MREKVSHGEIHTPIITTLGDKKKSESNYICPVEARTQSEGNAGGEA